jgi:hypothetical protein
VADTTTPNRVTRHQMLEAMWCDPNVYTPQPGAKVRRIDPTRDTSERDRQDID